jgi:hypothetical protein
MRLAYAIVLVLGIGAILVDHLVSPSSGRAGAHEILRRDGAPCPSTQRK